MAYTIKLSNNSTLATISDGTTDSSTSLTLIGRNFAGYGTFLNENFVYLLENFSSAASPSLPLLGQIWYDSGNATVKVNTGTQTSPIWKPIGGSVASTVPPTSPSIGDLWFNTGVLQQLSVWNGTNWTIIGPFNIAGVTAGAYPLSIIDNVGGTHPCIQLNINGVPYAILSYTSFVPSTTGLQANLAGFTSSVTGYAYGIKSGLNFNPAITTSMGLNTQDISATPYTLIQRDINGSANVTILTATQGINACSVIASSSVTAQTVTAISSISAPSITGNLTATTVTASTISASTIGTSSGTGVVGTIQTANQPNITSLGTLTGLTVSGTTNLNGTSYYKGAEIATIGGAATMSFIDGVPIGGNVASTGAFTTVAAGGLQAQAIGNVTPGTAAFTRASITTANITTANVTSYTGTTVAVTGNISGNVGIFNSISVGGVGSSAGNLTVSYITASGGILPSSANAVNLGSTTNWFNNIYGTAIHSLYADLAERFAADTEYPPGTVVELGGPAEITKVVAELSNKVFGVISTNAAYLMNSKAGTDTTHPPIAMSGRVPVRVVGLITKGDRLVSAGNGIARAGKNEELTPWNVIGRSLVDKLEAGEGIIEAIVKINS